VGSRLIVDADVVGVKGRKVFTRAVGRLGDHDGPIAVSAAALFIQVPLQHFVDHGSAEQVQQAIGNPAAIAGMIQSGLFSSYLRNSGITDTLGDLSNITQQGAKQSTVIQQMYRPIDLNAYKRLETPFEGTASFRDEEDPLKQFRAVENAYSNFQEMLQQAQSKRRELNIQIAVLNDQLKGAQDDAEVQKLQGSLTTAQTSLKDLDGIMDGAEHQVRLLHMLNENRAASEAIAAEEISRARNRESAKMGSDAEASAAKSASQSDMPPGF
jgi:hypothetical protein